MLLLPLHGVLFFQHIASKLDKCLLLPPYSLALSTLAGAHKYVCISPLDHVLLLLDAVPFVCDMAFVFDMVPSASPSSRSCLALYSVPAVFLLLFLFSCLWVSCFLFFSLGMAAVRLASYLVCWQ